MKIITSILFLFFLSSHLWAGVPQHRSEIHSPGAWLAWAFFGNDDDGIYGEKPTAGQWTDEKIGSKRAVMWWIRNPMHNFTYYVIGSADKQNSEFVLLQLADEGCLFMKYRKKGGTVFAGKSTSFFLGFHGWKPFVSLRLDYGRLFDCYAGWRERGNFGLKCILAGKKKECHTKTKIGAPHGSKKKIQSCGYWSGTGRVCSCHSCCAKRTVSCSCRKRKCGRHMP